MIGCKRILSMGLTLALLASTTGVAFGAAQATAYLRTDVTVKYDAVTYDFADANGTAVYPIIYGGSTYLPVRAMSELMGESIEWNNSTKSVYIGKTLSNLGKTLSQDASQNLYAKPRMSADVQPAPGAAIVSVYLKPDVSVLYDFELQQFSDEQGRAVYPIIYNNSSYLPVRAVSKLMGEDILWDQNTKTVYIGSLVPKVEVEEPEISESAELLQKLYDREVKLFDKANDKISKLSEISEAEELITLANDISKYYASAQSYNSELQRVDTDDFSKREMKAYNRLSSFAQKVEYYVLVLENIAYMAASESDYSMLAETFYSFAVEASEEMDAAREAIENLSDD